ncbi:MAG: putative negative regulator of RcsB-dependent stress response [Arenicella sp.]|jgi:predicted negative regulator of RcsB-dependent stress response
MVDDILLSPQEQDERAKQWLKDNGMAIVIGISLGLAAVFGYNNYQAKQITNAEQASSIYDTVLGLVNDSELADIESQVTSLKEGHSDSSYAAKGALLRARQLSVSDLDAAFDELAWVVSNAQEYGLKHTALIRQAKILVSQGKLEEAKAIVLTQPYQGFDSFYQEILGDIAAQQGEFSSAGGFYQSALATLGEADQSYAAILTLKKDRLPIASAAGISSAPAAVTPEEVDSNSEIDSATAVSQ